MKEEDLQTLIDQVHLLIKQRKIRILSKASVEGGTIFHSPNTAHLVIYRSPDEET